MRCGPPESVSLKLNLPEESAFVLAATSMPLERLMRMTSSPAAGLLVVPLVTVPERVWAEAEARETTTNKTANQALLIKSAPLSPMAYAMGCILSPLCGFCGDALTPLAGEAPALHCDQLQPCDFGHDGGGFFFQGGAHGLVIDIGNFAGFVFKIQVAE